jgi:hypothetical protein
LIKENKEQAIKGAKGLKMLFAEGFVKTGGGGVRGRRGIIKRP